MYLQTKIIVIIIHEWSSKVSQGPQAYEWQEGSSVAALVYRPQVKACMLLLLFQLCLPPCRCREPWWGGPLFTGSASSPYWNTPRGAEEQKFWRFFWRPWSLNSGPHTCQAGALTAWVTPPAPFCDFCMCVWLSRKLLFGLANYYPSGLYFGVARITV
jgi:hypothetical protein